MKTSKKILVSGLVICSILAGALISGCTTTMSEKKAESIKEEISKIPYVFPYDPEVLLPEVIVGNQSIWGSNVNLTVFYKLPYYRIFIKKYYNQSKELIEIMKMQVALLGEDPELFEKCIYSIKEVAESLQNDSETCLALLARRTIFQGGYCDKKYNGREVWELTFSFTGPNEPITRMATFYVDVHTLEPFPFVCETD